jgi:hypothetical protein
VVVRQPHSSLRTRFHLHGDDKLVTVEAAVHELADLIPQCHKKAEVMT